MALLGKNGFKKLGEVNLANSHYAAERIGELEHVKAPLFSGPFFGEFTVGYERRSAADVFAELAKRGVMAGYPLSRHSAQIGEAGALLRDRGPLERGHRAPGRCPGRGRLKMDKTEHASSSQGESATTAQSEKRSQRYRQAFWDEPLLSEIGRKGRLGFIVPEDAKIKEWAKAKGEHRSRRTFIRSERRPTA